MARSGLHPTFRSAFNHVVLRSMTQKSTNSLVSGSGILTRQMHLEPSPNSTQSHVPALAGSNSARQSLEESGSDARFEVLGSSSSMLSVSLNASQDLYTRRGTLVGVSGDAENVVSSLSVLQPFQRFITGVPFLYQKVSSPSPITALLGATSPSESFIVVPLDGRLDWVIARRSGLLAWTGRSLTLKPRINVGLSVSHWGNTFVSGRGLLALSGRGQIYEMSLKQGEEYVVHPSHILAYTSTSILPSPFRLPFNSFRLQLPRFAWFPSLIPQTIRQNDTLVKIRDSAVWNYTVSAFRLLATRIRTLVYGDRLFLKFSGPATILVQSRGGRLRDVLGDREVNEIAGISDFSVRLEGTKQTGSIKEAEKPIGSTTSTTSSSSSASVLSQDPSSRLPSSVKN